MKNQTKPPAQVTNTFFFVNPGQKDAEEKKDLCFEIACNVDNERLKNTKNLLWNALSPRLIILCFENKSNLM